MVEDNANGTTPQGNLDSVKDCLARAAAACESGNPVLGMHLYLAAFGFACAQDQVVVCEDAVRGLKRAWSVACGLKERSLAEYIFEKMEPYLSSDEVSHCANQLQELALDKLAEYGLPREALQDMSEMISSDFLGLTSLPGASVIAAGPSQRNSEFSMEVPFIDGGLDVAGLTSQVSPEANTENPAVTLVPDHDVPKKRRGASTPAQPENDTSAGFFEGLSEGDDLPPLSDEELPDPLDEDKAPDSSKPSDEELLRQAFEQVKARMVPEAASTGVSRIAERLDYTQIHGYYHAMDYMAAMGIGVANDPDFQALVKELNRNHGLDRMPAADSLLFRAPAREDASRFLQATLGELGLPSLRMTMEENFQGVPVLCVMADAAKRPKMNAAHNALVGPAVLVIEDLDMWMVPQFDQGEGVEGLVMSQMSRGAREAITLIRNSVEDPDVYVLASLSSFGEVDPFFCDLLAPFSVMEIENPDVEERYDIWWSLVTDHPSLSSISADEFVYLSANMSRADIYLAVREAIEESYKDSLAMRSYLPVRPENLFEKLSAYQPLDSKEYQQLEDCVAALMRAEMNGTVDDFLGL